MKPDSVRTSIDIPKELHRQLQEAAARMGTSARQLILKSIERVVSESNPKPQRKRLSLERAIVPSRGKPFDMTAEEIHDLIDFP